jgi:hypothetical protein
MKGTNKPQSKPPYCRDFNPGLPKCESAHDIRRVFILVTVQYINFWRGGGEAGIYTLR